MKRRIAAFVLAAALLLSIGCAAASGYYRVNTSWLKSRKSPSYSATVTDSFRRDFAVQILSRRSDGWAKVRFYPAGLTGYVRAQYLKASKSYTAYISTDSVLIRKGPAATFGTVKKVNRGTKVTVLTHGAAFDYVSCGGKKGYVRNSCLTVQKPAGRTAFVQNPAHRKVNLRSGPGKGYKVMAEYSPGTKVTILKKGSSWSKIQVGGRTGYMMTRYLRH